MFEYVGEVIELAEPQLDAVTALSGSVPAYFFYLVEAMIDAGILLGLPRPDRGLRTRRRRERMGVREYRLRRST